MSDLESAKKAMKNNKAAGLDVLVEQIEHSWDQVHTDGFLIMVNECVSSKKIPKTWRKAENMSH